MPTIVGKLHGLNHYTWVTISYVLASTVSLPLWGKLGDMYGRKHFFQLSILLFLIGSALCGLSQTYIELVGFRALQGIGSGGLMVGSMAIIGDIVPPRERGRYQGYIGSVFAVSTIADVRNTMFMSGIRPFPRTHWETLAPAMREQALIHRKVMTAMHDLDDTKMIVNQSGGVPGGPSGDIPHMRPYEHFIRADYMDDHTVGAESRFSELDFASHRSAVDRMNGGIVGTLLDCHSNWAATWHTGDGSPW